MLEKGLKNTCCFFIIVVKKKKEKKKVKVCQRPVIISNCLVTKRVGQRSNKVGHNLHKVTKVKQGHKGETRSQKRSESTLEVKKVMEMVSYFKLSSIWYGNYGTNLIHLCRMDKVIKKDHQNRTTG